MDSLSAERFEKLVRRNYLDKVLAVSMSWRNIHPSGKNQYRNHQRIQ